MNEIFRPFLRKFVLVFFDDILVYSKEEGEHRHHVELVLRSLRENGLVVNGGKCEFRVRRVAYLGHVISEKGVEVEDGKVKAMLAWPTPKTLKELRGFLGLTGYYRRFVQGYAHRAKCLTRLLQKDAFIWDEEAEKTFHGLKLAMTQVPVLAMPNFQMVFVVEKDACHSRPFARKAPNCFL